MGADCLGIVYVWGQLSRAECIHDLMILHINIILGFTPMTASQDNCMNFANISAEGRIHNVSYWRVLGILERFNGNVLLNMHLPLG